VRHPWAIARVPSELISRGLRTESLILELGELCSGLADVASSVKDVWRNMANLLGFTASAPKASLLELACLLALLGVLYQVREHNNSNCSCNAVPEPESRFLKRIKDQKKRLRGDRLWNSTQLFRSIWCSAIVFMLLFKAGSTHHKTILKNKTKLHRLLRFSQLVTYVSTSLSPLEQLLICDNNVWSA
jgi:hypothetical protein